MPEYSYVGIKFKELVKGEINAKDKSDAESKLREQQIQPTRIYLPQTYDDIQFISYEVNTFPREGKGLNLGKRKHTINGKIHKLPTFSVTDEYLGEVDSTKDIENRITLVKEAIEAAEDHSQISSDKKCLKLFMLPEFYFRGSTGAYSLDDYQKVVEELRKLVKEFRKKSKAKDALNHWLFVFGTILAVYEPITIETKGSRGKMAGRKAILNTVLVQKGAAGEEKSCVIIKDVMSDIDFSRQKKIQYEAVSGQRYVIKKKAAPKHLWDENVDHLKSGKLKGFWKFKKWSANQKTGKETQVANYSGLGIFEMEKITFGLEVCLDHYLQRLRKSPPPKDDNWIQVQLIPSAGMIPFNKSIIACKEGWVFNCDGAPHTRIHKIKSEWRKKVNASLNKEEKPVADWEIHTTGDSVKILKESFQGKARLKIFNPKPIPDPRAV